MQKGGYQIIDLHDDLHTSGVGMVHEGVYEKIEATRKPILLSGITVNGVEYHDTFISPIVNGTNYVALVGINPTTGDMLIVNIQENDVVIFTTNTSPN